jgi:hypothetical protein
VGIQKDKKNRDVIKTVLPSETTYQVKARRNKTPFVCGNFVVPALKLAFPFQPCEWVVDEYDMSTQEYFDYVQLEKQLPKYLEKEKVMTEAGLKYEIVRLFEGRI